MNLCLFPDIDGTDAVTEEAVAFVRQHLSDKGEIFVAFSGGKDSIVTAEIMRRSGVPHQLFYSATGIDPPEVVRFIRKHYPDCNLLKPRFTFWRDLSTNVPPSGKLRWCCKNLKKRPSWRLPHKHRVLGIRSEESNRRATYGRISHKEKLDHVEHYPIFDWKEWQLWEFIHKNNLPYPSLYDEGFDRIGCVICPYHSEPTGKLHMKYRNRWPWFFTKFEKEIANLYHKRVSQGRRMHFASPEEFVEAWYRNNSARWKAE